jgi:hypothetical protein
MWRRVLWGGVGEWIYLLEKLYATITFFCLLEPNGEGNLDGVSGGEGREKKRKRTPAHKKNQRCL